jgi:hypothetical protein
MQLFHSFFITKITCTGQPRHIVTFILQKDSKTQVMTDHLKIQVQSHLLITQVNISHLPHLFHMSPYTGLQCSLNDSTLSTVGRGSIVGIVTGDGLEGLGIEFHLGARFSTPIQTGPGAHPASY